MRSALEGLVTMAALVSGVWLGVWYGREVFPPPPPAVSATPAVVRVLDIVVRDSNTTGRRQRFECRAAVELKETKR